MFKIFMGGQKDSRKLKATQLATVEKLGGDWRGRENWVWSLERWFKELKNVLLGWNESFKKRVRLGEHDPSF